MTKFTEWLTGAVLILGVWSAVLTKKISHPILNENWNLVLYFPIILLAVFGIYAVTVVLWRVYTFNDCEDAAKELKEQIEAAREDLKKKGFKFECEEVEVFLTRTATRAQRRRLTDKEIRATTMKETKKRKRHKLRVFALNA